MKDDVWAQYLRLQEMERLCRDDTLKDALDGALDRELAAIAAGRPRRGTVATAISNHRRRERRRREIELTLAVTATRSVDAWHQIEERAELEARLRRVDPPARELFLQHEWGDTAAALAAERQRPVGTIKARLHRIRLQLAA